MKQSTQPSNHEMWHECTLCGAVYDRRKYPNTCPECGTVYSFRYSGLCILSPLIFGVLILLILTSCGITKKYGYRHHRNTVAQKVIQYEASKPYRWGEWKACQHFSERPKSHWPLKD